MVGDFKVLYSSLMAYKRFFFIVFLGLVVCTSHAQADERFSDFLPFGKQLVDDDSKAKLPLPIGINFNFFSQEQDLDLDKVSLSSTSANPAFASLIPMLPGLDLPEASIESDVQTYTLSLDAWILPFLNIYVVIGCADGESTLESNSVSYPGSGLTPQQLAVQLAPFGISMPFEFGMDYDGDVYGGGMTLAGGYKDFFCSLDMNYTYTDLDISDSTIETFTCTPRVGISGNLGSLAGKIWAGAMYQDTTEEIEGEAILDTNFGPLLVNFNVEQSAEDPWNYVIGGQWDISKAWNILLEIGMGERESLYVSGVFRL